MENTRIIEELVDLSQLTFVSGADFDKFSLLLEDIGVSRDSSYEFFVYPEGETFPIGISSYALKSKLKDNTFLIKFASHLLDFLEDVDKQYLLGTMRNEGYILDDKQEFISDKIAFEVKYSEIDRVLRVNGVEIARLRLNGENDTVFGYIYKNPNIELRIVNDEIASGIPVLKKMDTIVKNLGFFGEARRLFFPKVNDGIVEFRNPITWREMKDRGFKSTLTIEQLFSKIFKDK